MLIRFNNFYSMIKNSIACIVAMFLYNTGNAVLYYHLPFRQRKFHLNGKGIFLHISSPRKDSSMVFNDSSTCLKTDLSALYLVLLLKNMVLEQDVQHILPLVDLNL